MTIDDVYDTIKKHVIPLQKEKRMSNTECIVCNNEFLIDEARFKSTLKYTSQLSTVDCGFIVTELKKEIVVHKTCGSFIRNLIDRLKLKWDITSKFEVVK